MGTLSSNLLVPLVIQKYNRYAKTNDLKVYFLESKYVCAP